MCLSSATLAAMAAHMIINPSYSKLTDIYNKLSPPIDIRSIQKFSSNKYALERGDWFPTDRKSKKRELSTEINKIITEWFTKIQIQLEANANTAEKQFKARRLFYTQQDYFVENIWDIHVTNLIKLSIDLKPGAQPVRGKIPRYTAAEKAFANKIFPVMEDVGVIVRRSSK